MAEPKYSVSIYLTTEDLAALDRLRVTYGSRAHAIRMLIRWADAARTQPPQNPRRED